VGKGAEVPGTTMLPLETITVLLTVSTDEGTVDGNSAEVVSGLVSEDVVSGVISDEVISDEVVSGEAVLKDTNSEDE
jgi:hypothetical protein